MAVDYSTPVEGVYSNGSLSEYVPVHLPCVWGGGTSRKPTRWPRNPPLHPIHLPCRQALRAPPPQHTAASRARPCPLPPCPAWPAAQQSACSVPALTHRCPATFAPCQPDPGCSFAASLNDALYDTANDNANDTANGGLAFAFC